MVDFYQIKSPLSQITEGHINSFIESVSSALGEELRSVSLEQYLSDDFALLYVASGGSEGFFLEVFEQLKARPCYILTSGESNSLAASMEILSFLRKHGGNGEILHGDISEITEKIRALKLAHSAKAKLRGKRIGIIGTPSDWLIASSSSETALMEKLGMGFVSIPMSELFDEIAKNEYVPNEQTELFLSKGYDRAEVEKALYVYGAVSRLVDKYELCGVTVRCFDLLDTVRTTGCLALAILNAEGICGGCEGDIPALVSMVVLRAVTGEPAFLCNPSRLYTKEGYGTFAHCTIPVTMLKEFCLNTHFESGIGVAVQGTFADGDCTVFKCEGDLSRYFVKEGHLTASPYSEMLCRTQVRLYLDDFSYFLTEPINNHHLVCLGKHAAAVDAFFNLLK